MSSEKKPQDLICPILNQSCIGELCAWWLEATEIDGKNKKDISDCVVMFLER